MPAVGFEPGDGTCYTVLYDVFLGEGKAPGYGDPDALVFGFGAGRGPVTAGLLEATRLEEMSFHYRLGGIADPWTRAAAELVFEYLTGGQVASAAPISADMKRQVLQRWDSPGKDWRGQLDRLRR